MEGLTARVMGGLPDVMDMDAAMSKFKGARAKATAGSSSGTSAAQVESKNKAAARNRKLAKAPLKVKAKWEELCSLKGRSHNKAELKRKFTDWLLETNDMETATGSVLWKLLPPRKTMQRDLDAAGQS